MHATEPGRSGASGKDAAGYQGTVEVDRDLSTGVRGVFARQRPNPHIAFGRGKFYCLGADLARVALRTVCEQLPQRLPGLGLHAPWAVLSTDKERVTGGLRTLLVSW